MEYRTYSLSGRKSWECAIYNGEDNQSGNRITWKRGYSFRWDSCGNQNYSVNHWWKMTKLCDGAGGAACQLCTATKFDLKDLYFIRNGFPINRTIQTAKQIFEEVDIDDFVSLPSHQRFGITENTLQTMIFSPYHNSIAIWECLVGSWLWFTIYMLITKTNGHQVSQTWKARKDLYKSFWESTQE